MTYHSLTPRQQRVWDAAYGTAMALSLASICDTTNLPPTEADAKFADRCARPVANLAANSIQPNETEPNECHT
jgi:hypothetical protein